MHFVVPFVECAFKDLSAAHHIKHTREWPTSEVVVGTQISWAHGAVGHHRCLKKMAKHGDYVKTK